MILNTKIEIEWIDAATEPTWLSVEKAMARPSDVDCLTIGYFIKQDEEFLYISHSRSTSLDGTRDRTVIPLGCIKKITPQSDYIEGL